MGVNKQLQHVDQHSDQKNLISFEYAQCIENAAFNVSRVILRFIYKLWREMQHLY